MIVCMFIIVVVHLMFLFFFSSRRRHTRCALLTGVQSVLFRSPIPAKRASTPPTAGPADVRGTNTRQTCIHAPNLSPAASTRTRRPGERPPPPRSLLPAAPATPTGRPRGPHLLARTAERRGRQECGT